MIRALKLKTSVAPEGLIREHPWEVSTWPGYCSLLTLRALADWTPRLLPDTLAYYMMPKYLIYGLIDPETLLVRYIGKSSRGLTRPGMHRNQKTQHGYCGHWVRGLQSRGLDYTITVLEVCAKEDLNVSECWWIAYGFACNWPLTNLTMGGDGGPSGDLRHMKRPEQRERQRKLTAALWTPERHEWFRTNNPSKRPEVQALQSVAGKLRMSRPGEREKLNAAANSPERRAAKSVLFRSDASPFKTPEAKKKQQDTWTDERRAIMSERVRKNPPMHQPETAAKVGAAIKRAWEDPAYRDAHTGDNHPARRRPELVAHMSGDTNPAKTPEAREKIKASWTPERREAMSKRTAERNRQNTGKKRNK